MRFLAFIISALCFLNSYALDLNEALEKAYTNNLSLQTQREKLKKEDEQIMQSLSEFLPNIRAQSRRQDQTVRSYTNSDTATTGTTVDGKQTTHQITVSQNIFKGFGHVAGMSAAKNAIRAARADLTRVEQQVLLGAVESYLNVVNAELALKIYEDKVESYRKLVYSVKEKFKGGEATRTDVAQAEAQYSQAISSRISAQGTLRAARASFKSIIGEDPINLKIPELSTAIPATVDDAINLAQQKNPQISMAKYQKDASEYGVTTARAGLLPSADLELGRNKNTNSSGLSTYSTTATLSVSMSLFDGGKSWSGLRSAKRGAAIQKYNLKNIQNDIFNKTVEAWQNFEIAKASLSAKEDALDASKIAWEGIQIEEQAGTRDIVEVIQVQNNYFDNNLGLLKGKIDYFIRYYALKAQLGELTAKDLKLKVAYYDPLKNYNKITKELIGSF